MAIWGWEKMAMNLIRKAQIKAQNKAQTKIIAQVGALLFNEALIAILAEYSNYNNVFSVEYVAKLPRYTRINNHAINLEKYKQSFFGLIYNLGLIVLKTLKTYIQTNLANSFIWSSKFSAEALILFDWKPDGSLRLWVDY